MAINSGFEPDANDADENRTQAPKTATSTNNNANENTAFNVNLDTYFSEEKIRIPDRVIVSIFNYFKIVFHFELSK